MPDEGVVLDICDKGEMITVCLIIKLKFWEYWTRFDSKHFWGDIIIVFEVNHIYDIHKKWPTNDPPASTIRKNEQQIYCLK